jgi:hypothetical protein
MRRIPARLGLAVALALAATTAACGSSPSSSSSSSSASTSGSSSAPAPAATTSSVGATTSSSSSGFNPNQRESLPPGDIPDTIAYVPYAVPGKGLTISAPEGWSRANSAQAVKFTDKLNEIQLFTLPAKAPVTVASAKATEAPKIGTSVKTFKLQSVTMVSRTAGPAVRVAYLGDSPPNPVTGKIGTLAFERYDFFHKGREVVVLLSSPLGSDNVDPWRKVTNSLTFTK